MAKHYPRVPTFVRRESSAQNSLHALQTEETKGPYSDLVMGQQSLTLYKCDRNDGEGIFVCTECTNRKLTCEIRQIERSKTRGPLLNAGPEDDNKGQAVSQMCRSLFIFGRGTYMY